MAHLVWIANRSLKERIDRLDMAKGAVMKRWRFKQEAVGIICALCGEPISKSGDKGKGSLTADHIIPKSMGGTYAKTNLQPAHLICNRQRQTMLTEEFKDLKSREAILRRAIEIIDNHERPIMSKVKRLFKGSKS